MIKSRIMKLQRIENEEIMIVITMTKIITTTVIMIIIIIIMVAMREKIRNWMKI